MENNQKIVCNGVSSLYVLYKTARPQSTTYDRIENFADNILKVLRKKAMF